MGKYAPWHQRSNRGTQGQVGQVADYREATTAATTEVTAPSLPKTKNNQIMLAPTTREADDPARWTTTVRSEVGITLALLHYFKTIDTVSL